MTGEIRPGVSRPDWSVVTKPAARSALMGRIRIRSGISEKWNRGLPPAEDLAWRKILELFATNGRAPSVLEIAESICVSDEQARTILADLRAYDLLGLDGPATTISYAYPFAGLPTEHRVELYGRHLYAVCAIDALGVPGMFRTDATIASSCRACGSRIEVGTAGNGKSLSHYRPAEAVIWYDSAYIQAQPRRVARPSPSSAPTLIWNNG
jgi:hypothetical protein